MKLCDVVQFYSPLGGGVKRYLEDKLRFISLQPGIEHAVIIPSSRNEVGYRLHSRFYEIQSFRLIGSQSYRMLLSRRRILSIVDEERPDLIEVGDPYRSAWIALEAAERGRIPVVAFYHSDFPRALGRTISRFCGPWVERLLSHGVERYVRDLYNRMSATVVAGRRMEYLLKECGIQRVVRIPLGTDVTVFHPHPDAGQVREELGLDENDMLLLFVGRLAREKNIRSLVGMMENLASRTSSRSGRYHLLLVGDGELCKFVERTVQTRQDVTWYRYCESAERLAAYYTAADLFVHAGRYETFGITSLEAQSCGTRVLAVEGGGLDDTVSGENPLIMAKSPDPVDLADGVRCVQDCADSQSPEERRRRIVDHFSIRLTFERLFGLYEHILRGLPVESFAITAPPENEDELVRPAVLTG